MSLFGISGTVKNIHFLEIIHVRFSGSSLLLVPPMWNSRIWDSSKADGHQGTLLDPQSGPFKRITKSSWKHCYNDSRFPNLTISQWSRHPPRCGSVRLCQHGLQETPGAPSRLLWAATLSRKSVKRKQEVSTQGGERFRCSSAWIRPVRPSPAAQLQMGPAAATWWTVHQPGPANALMCNHADETKADVTQTRRREVLSEIDPPGSVYTVLNHTLWRCQWKQALLIVWNIWNVIYSPGHLPPFHSRQTPKSEFIQPRSSSETYLLVTPTAFQSSFCLKRLQAEINAGKAFQLFQPLSDVCSPVGAPGTVSLLLVSVCWLFSPPCLSQIYVHLRRGNVAAAEQKLRHPACGARHQPLGQVQDRHDGDGRCRGRTVRRRSSALYWCVYCVC